MTTGGKIALLGGLAVGGGVLYMLFRRPLVQAPNGQLVQGPSKIDELANRAGAVAQVTGTKIASAIPILAPISKAVGASAGMDTVVNVRETANVWGGTKQILTGNVVSGTKQIVTSSAKIAVSPVKSALKIVGISW